MNNTLSNAYLDPARAIEVLQAMLLSDELALRPDERRAVESAIIALDTCKMVAS